jgi:glutathione synthase/RimK-type ligase-like ATP-grasp enzyme
MNQRTGEREDDTVQTRVGVLCARVRVEEKQLLTTLAAAGFVAEQVFPAAPLPIPPAPPSPVRPGSATEAGPGALIDRCQNRAAAGPLVRLHRALGAPVVDAGIAATNDRLAVASALAMAGVARPETRLATSAEAALTAIAAFGYPATLLPLAPGTAPIAILDADTAEAVLEHREVLGASRDLPSLVQAGIANDGEAAVVIVAGGLACAVSGPDASAIDRTALHLAETAAAALDASLISIRLLRTDSGWVVWDVDAVPDFRAATDLVEGGVAGSIARLLGAGAKPAAIDAAAETITLQVSISGSRKEARHDALLFA